MANVNVEVVGPNVDGWLSTMDGYANSAFNSASNLASSLASFNPVSYYPETNFNNHIPDVKLTNPGDISSPDLDIINRTPPSNLALDVPVVDIGLGDVPELTAIPPSISLPSRPSKFDGEVPTKDFVLDLSKEFPIAPSTDLPDVPTLVDLSLPDDISILLPLFTGELPDSATIGVPTYTFSFTEDIYSSDLLSAVQVELLSRLGRSTGLVPKVEQAVWDRARDREHVASLQAERALTVDKASTGFTRPSGALLSAIDRATQESQNKIIDLSRDIMIKQAELEQENFKFSMQQAISLEDILIRQHNNVQQRSFEVAKYMQEIGIEIYKALVSKYNVELEAYKAASQVFESNIKAELSKVEVFKAQIDAEKTKGEINDQNIRIYLARIQAINATVDMYKTQVSAVSEELKAEGLKVDVYKGDIDAYSSLVSAKAEEYRSYSEQVKGELAKVDVYESQVKAYTSRIQAYSIGKDTEIKQADLKIDIEGLKVKKYLADIEGFIKQVQADQMTYQASVDVYKGQLQGHLAELSYNTASAELNLKQSDMIIDQNKFEVSSALERIKIRANIINAQNQGKIEGMKAAGSTYAQLASSSLNAINVSAGFSGNASAQISESWNHALTS